MPHAGPARPRTAGLAAEKVHTLMALHAVTRRILAAGGAAGLLALAGAGAAYADTTPPPPPTSITIPESFSGGGTGSTADAASAAATAAAMAEQAAFEKDSGGMCTDTSTDVKSWMAGDQYAAIANVMATCTVPVPSSSGGSGS